MSYHGKWRNLLGEKAWRNGNFSEMNSMISIFERKIILTGFVWRAVGVAKLWELLLFGTLVGVPVLLLLLLLLLTLLFPTPWNPLDTSSMLGVTGGREGGGLQGGTACGSDARPLFVPWLGDLHILSYTFDFSDNANDCG